MKLRVQDTRAKKSDERHRRNILEKGYRPMILSDGRQRYWDGISVIGSYTKSWRDRIVYPGGKREIRIMTREGIFPEA